MKQLYKKIMEKDKQKIGDEHNVIRDNFPILFKCKDLL